MADNQPIQYHLNPTTKNPQPCRNPGTCNQADHFPSFTEAQRHYEALMILALIPAPLKKGDER